MTKITPQLARDIHKRASEIGGWEKHGVKTQVCKEFGLSRPTLDGLLEKYPTYTERGYAEYKNFYEIPEVQQFLKLTGKEQAKRLLKCWLALDSKNPMNWTSEDLAILRQHPTLIDTMTGLIKYHYLVSLRKFLETYRTELYQKEKKNLLYTKKTKRQKGTKRKWFLTPDELNRFLQKIDNIEFLTQTLCHVKWGCRNSALIHKTLTVSQITKIPPSQDNIKGLVSLYEPKTGKQWVKWIDNDTMNTLEEYTKLRNLKPDDRLFPHRLEWFNDKMKEYGIKAGLCQYNKIKVKYPNCVNKSWPQFWRFLEDSPRL